MNKKILFVAVVLASLASVVIGAGLFTGQAAARPVPPAQLGFMADNPVSPTQPVKLIFIHHSTGGNWLADPTGNELGGDLGQALMNNNYYVSATNYGWGPDAIGDRTDIPNWPEWFTGSSSATYLAAVYAETGQNFGDFGSWPRLAQAPSGENVIIMFKSCFPNSDLYGNPTDPPLSEPNDQYTVENAKAVYNNILTYFATRQDKLFVVITAPPLRSAETTAARAANARAFNNWLLDKQNGWLKSYSYQNVAVFDFYNVLTSNGGNANTPDTNSETGNHHRWHNGAEQHIQTVNNNYAAYPSGDSHPSQAGNQKATAEFVQMLNVFYNRWKNSGPLPQDKFVYLPVVLRNYTPAPPVCAAPLTGVTISGTTSGVTNTSYTFTANPTPVNATTPITYIWSPEPTSGQNSASATYQWNTTGNKPISVTASNCGGTFEDAHTITIAPAATTTIRSMPDTTNGIHVFNDQLANMSEEQFQFAATHYAGTQKMTRADADHLRAYNPDFVILHYRLGMGLGYRGVQTNCVPSGDWLAVIEGDNWVQEWPGDGNVTENWFYHWPITSTTRVLNCDWGWYLMNPDEAAWRTYWSGEVLRQLQANAADGLFADSFSVPNYLGFDHYNPNLPENEAAFESEWTTRLNNFMTFAQQGSLATYHFIPNAGQWVTSRETTDYSIADGVMIEGFGGWGYASYFDLADWQLQMDRILGLVNQDKIVLAQQYIDADNVNDRMFLLGSYLLIKGRYTYINFDLDLDPEWFPEYGIPIGSPVGSGPANIAALWNAGWGVYTRTYSNGLVLVNPTTITQTINLGQPYNQATPNGGGFVPANGDVSAWTVTYTSVTSVTLAPNRAAVLLNAAPPPSSALIQPADLTYLGAFRLPDGAAAPRTFEYGGNAMTFNPDGHITNTDAFSGSLFITGHDRTDAYPDGSQFAEVSIPPPVNSRNVDDLPYAEFIQGFHNVTAGHFRELSTVPKIGIQYLNHADTGPKIHITWGRHLQQLEDFLPSQAWVSANLAQPNFQGEWFIGDQNPNSVNGYLFDIPTAWAEAHAQGRYLATGRFSPGGMGGMGPALIAYRPWLTGGAAPISGTHLSETPLLLYARAVDTSEITRCLSGYQHADNWEGGAWLAAPSGKSAVLFAGTKATGIKYWYGYIHPTNTLSPCVDLAETSFTTCRLANGAECPPADYAHCCEEGVDCVSARGWWSTRSDAQLLLYAPADLERVAAGTLQAWQPQPYAVIDIDERLYLNPPEGDRFEVGWGDQRRDRIGAVAVDRNNGLLYVLELYGDSAKPMVHVWRVQRPAVASSELDAD